jgi:hypothetical protein
MLRKERFQIVTLMQYGNTTRVTDLIAIVCLKNLTLALRHSLSTASCVVFVLTPRIMSFDMNNIYGWKIYDLRLRCSSRPHFRSFFHLLPGVVTR